MPKTKVITIPTESADDAGSSSDLSRVDPCSDELTALLSEGWHVSHVVPIQAGHVVDRSSGAGPSLACYSYTRHVLVFLERD